MKKITLLILPLLMVLLTVMNILYLDSVKYDLIYINLFVSICIIYILRNNEYTKTKTGVYFGLLNFYVLGIIMTYNLSEVYLDSKYRGLFILSLIIFLLTYIAVYELVSFKNLPPKFSDFNANRIYKLSIWGLFVPLAINLYVNISSFGGIREAFSISYAAKTYLQNNYILYLYHLIIPSLLIIIWYGKRYNIKTYKYKLIKNSGIVLSLLVMLLSKSRGNIVEIIFSILFLYLILNEKNSVSLKSKLKIITVLMTSIILIMSVGLVRNYNIGEDNVIINKQSIERNLVGSADTMDVYYYILENIPENHDYLYGRSFASTFVSFVPRSIWTSKPVSFGNEIMIYKYGHLITNYAVAPSYIGEWYANFGFFGILIGSMVLGFITKYIDSKKYSKQDVLWIVFLIISIFYFWRLMRGDFQSATIPYLIKVFYLMLLKIIARFKIVK